MKLHNPRIALQPPNPIQQKVQQFWQLKYGRDAWTPKHLDFGKSAMSISDDTLTVIKKSIHHVHSSAFSLPLVREGPNTSQFLALRYVMEAIA